MSLQGAALALIAATTGFAPWAVGAVLIGIGTALVYPTLIAAVGDVAHPSWRATAVGVYRFWRDAGYVVGALLGGVVADLFDLRAAVMAVAILSLVSGLVVAARMGETIRRAGTGRAAPPLTEVSWAERMRRRSSPIPARAARRQAARYWRP